MPNVWKPTRDEIAAAYGKSVRDVIAPDLKVLFVGINPSLYSAAVGHHFARPGNRFWPTLHEASFTDRLLSAFDDRALVEFGYGITNLVDQATARADELTAQELVAGARRLKRKIKRHRPARIAFLGITMYRTAFLRKDAVIGRQAEMMAGTEVWALPNPSGLNAHYQLTDFVRLYQRLLQ